VAAAVLNAIKLLFAGVFDQLGGRGIVCTAVTGTVVEWLACWTQAQKGLGSNSSRDAFG